ncbi:MAG: SIR2 family protein [Candidatus Jordarchaeaceae archaeon]
MAFFIGAGAARDESQGELQLPLGDDIKTYFLKMLNQDEESFKKKYGLKEVYPETVWAILMENKPNQVKITALRSLLDRKDGKLIPVPSSYRFIAKLVLHNVVNAIVTTNFDEKIDEAFRDEIKRKFIRDTILTIASDDNDFSAYPFREEFTDQFRSEKIRVRAITLHKLHGTFSKPATIISTAKPVSKPRREVLKNLINQHDVIIFIGYSGRDLDIQQGLESVLEELKGDLKKKEIWWASLTEPDKQMIDIIKSKFGTGNDKFTYYNVLASEALKLIWREVEWRKTS